MSAPVLIRAFVDLDDPEEIIDGSYWTPTMAGFRLVPSNAECPFCRCPMEGIRAHPFGRVIREKGQRSAKLAPAVVELLPASHEALKCTQCDTVMTRLKELEA